MSDSYSLIVMGNGPLTCTVLYTKRQEVSLFDTWVFSERYRRLCTHKIYQPQENIWNPTLTIINPWLACTARVTVVGFVRLSVCPLNLTPLECFFVLKTISRTQQATKVKTIVWISLKLLCYRDKQLPALHGYNRSTTLCARIERMR